MSTSAKCCADLKVYTNDYGATETRHGPSCPKLRTPEKSRPWTPAPWTELFAEQDGTITLVHGGAESRLTWEDEYLAVAAPDLYEALEGVVVYHEHSCRYALETCTCGVWAWGERARAALKKARGER